MTTEEIIAGLDPASVNPISPSAVDSGEQAGVMPLPVDAGKRKVDIPSIPGLTLVCYPKGYVCLQVKGKDFDGKRVSVGKPLYREQISELVEQLIAIGGQAKTYEEANGSVPF
jgi:hypothetical protein